MPRYQSYIICTSPRSGSTLLCKLLSATGKCGNPDSHFHEPSIADWLVDYGLSGGQFPNESAALTAIFDAARKRGSGNTGMFGLRMQRHSFTYFMRQMEILYPGFSSDSERIQAAFGNTLFIHLTRSNKLEQAISLLKATQSGLWHLATDGTELERLTEPQEPAYDAHAITQNLVELTEFEYEWKAWFASEKLEPLHVTYDELSGDPSEVLARILVQLGLDRQIAENILPLTAKLADTTSRSWAERFLAEQDQH